MKRSLPGRELRSLGKLVPTEYKELEWDPVVSRSEISEESRYTTIQIILLPAKVNKHQARLI